MEGQKQNLDFLSSKPIEKSQKYFGFPEEILHAHIKKHGIKII